MSKKAGGPGSPAFIEYKGTKFLIINQPSATTMSNFIDVSHTCITSVNLCVCVKTCGNKVIHMWAKYHIEFSFSLTCQLHFRRN